MPRGVPKAKKQGRGAKQGLDSFIQASVKYLRKYSADARALVLNQIAKDLRAAGKDTKQTRAPRKMKTVAQSQREIKESGADSGLAVGASTTGNTSGGLKRTEKKQKEQKRKMKDAPAGTGGGDVSHIPGVAEEATSH